jgi:glycosyltransferase involved in cell wall biosynthesis
VREGETAIVVAEADPRALADGIVTVLTDLELAARMAVAAPAWARTFDQAMCIARRDDAVENTVRSPAPTVRAPTVSAARISTTRRAACSVVLPTRDRPDMLDRALDRLSAALTPDDELVVVDSASHDPRVAEVALARGATVVRCELPGVNRARNAGWRATTHSFVLYLDDDVTVDPGWADAMVAALDMHPEVGFVAGRIEVPDDQIATGHPVALRTGDDSAVLTADTRGVLGHSASLAVRRTALDQIGGWDEALGAGGTFKSSPEVDLFDRLFAAGWVGRYEPAAMAWHDQWRGRADMVHLDWRYGYGAGARMAKLLRSDRHRAGVIAADVFWARGLRQAAINARKGYKTAVLLNLAEVAGATMGLLRALPVPVVDGHYVVKESDRPPLNR